MGVALYTAAWVSRGILSLAPDTKILGADALTFFIIVLGVLTGIYTRLGGLLAVVWQSRCKNVSVDKRAPQVASYGNHCGAQDNE